MRVIFIGNINNLNSELISILKNIGVKNIKHLNLIEKNTKFNESVCKENYIDFFNETNLHLVNKYFEKDFEYFGFQKCLTMIELNNYFHDKDKVQIKENFKKNNVELIKKIKEEENIF